MNQDSQTLFSNLREKTANFAVLNEARMHISLSGAPAD